MNRVGLVLAPAVALALVVACQDDRRAEKQGTPQTVRSLPAEAFRVEWIANTVPTVMKPGSSSNVSVTIKNSSNVAWPDPKSAGSWPPGAGAVRLAYRWVPASTGTPPSYSQSRADLYAPLQPGQSVTLNFAVTAPSAPGEYRLQFDLVQELVAWFEAKEAARLLVPVRVQ